jgi:serine/threonine protein kinase
MTVGVSEFWKLVLQSKLLTTEQCAKIGADFGHVKGASTQGNAKTLAEWMISRNILSRYQVTILLAGQPGPFLYGEYQIYDRIESGAMAGRFRASHVGTNMPVQLEFVTGGASEDPKKWARLAEHILEMGQARHPHLQRAFEPVDQQSYKYLVLQDAFGKSVTSQLANGKLPPAEASSILRRTAMALAAVHQEGQVHGGVRPEHIYLEPDGNVILLRKPTRRLVSPKLDKIDADPYWQAQADYLAPEFNQSSHAPDKLTDIYALGCTFYQLLSGRPPYPGGTVKEKLSRHSSERIQPLETMGVPQPLAQMVAYLMAKDSSVRYQDASAVAEQLGQFAAAAPPVNPAPMLAAYDVQLVSRRPAIQKKIRDALLDSGGTSAPTLGPPVATGSTKPSTGVVTPVAVPGAAGNGPIQINVGDKSNASPPASGVAVAGPPAAYSKSKTGGDKNDKMIRNLVWGLGGVGALAIIFIIALNFAGSGTEGGNVADNGGSQTTPVKNDDRDPDNDLVGIDTPPDPNDPPPATTQVVFVDDDGSTPWESPTSGEPASLRMVPPNGRITLISRPSDLNNISEGQRVLQALGPGFSAGQKSWEKASGIPLVEAEQIITTFHDNNADVPRVSYVVELPSAKSKSDLVSKWGSPAVVTTEGDSYYKSGRWCYYVEETDGNVQRFLMGEEADVREAARLRGAPSPMRRQLKQLYDSSDGERHFTALFYPNYLFSGGRKLFSGQKEKLLEPIDWFLGDDLQAGMVSMHVDRHFYVEMRMIGNAREEKNAYANQFSERLEKIPGYMEDYVVDLNVPPYWEKLSLRYPRMIQTLYKYSRVGVSDNEAIINSRLPSVAAHNLITATELAIATGKGGGGGVVSQPTPTGPKTIEEAMESTVSMAFPQDSLEFSVKNLADAVKDKLGDLPFEFDIKIIGDDLKLEGITRNQQIRDFDQKNKPASEVLTAMVRKANPVTTVQDPSEVDQKLVWVIGPDPADPARKIVLVTTREAAKTKNYTLPAVFQPK